DQVRQLPRQPRAWHDQVEAGGLGTPAQLDLRVRIEAEPRAARHFGRVDQLDVRDHEIGIGPWLDKLVAGRAQPALDARAEHQLRRYDRDARHGAYCANRRRNSWRTDSGRPHVGSTGTRPLRTSRTASSPVTPSRSSAVSVPCTVSGAAAWPNARIVLKRQW